MSGAICLAGALAISGYDFPFHRALFAFICVLFHRPDGANFSALKRIARLAPGKANPRDADLFCFDFPAILFLFGGRQFGIAPFVGAYFTSGDTY